MKQKIRPYAQAFFFCLSPTGHKGGRNGTNQPKQNQNEAKNTLTVSPSHLLKAQTVSLRTSPTPLESSWSSLLHEK